MATGFWTDFRRRFSRGLAAILPTILTIAVLVWLFNIVNDHIGQRIISGGKWLAGWGYSFFWNVELTNAQARVREALDTFWVDIAGFVLAIVLIYILGLFVASIIGHTVWQSIERLLMRLPLIRQIYPSVKQVTDFVLKEQQVAFQRVIALQYPRQGLWSLGLVTNTGLASLMAATGEELLTVFIPSSPTPFTGYTITVRRDEVIDLPLSIEEALRFTVSGGVIMPMTETSAEAQVRQATGRAPVGRLEELTGATQGQRTEESST